MGGEKIMSYIKIGLDPHELIKLKGDGLCECAGCREKSGWNRKWVSMCYEYNGKIYCSDCIAEIIKKENLQWPIN